MRRRLLPPLLILIICLVLACTGWIWMRRVGIDELCDTNETRVYTRWCWNYYFGETSPPDSGERPS